MSAWIDIIMLYGRDVFSSPLAPSAFLWLAIPFALLLPQGLIRKSYISCLPIIGILLLFLAPFGSDGQIEIFGHQLVLARLDELSMPFVAMFFTGLFLAVIYSWSARHHLEQISCLLYAASAISACLAGDLLTFFIFWELTSLFSLIIILTRNHQDAQRAAYRYFMMQVLSGLLLLGGIITSQNGLNFEVMSLDWAQISASNISVILIFCAFAIKAAFPLLHFWLSDSYPESSPWGCVFLSIFTTKLAIYALARSFVGTDILITIGAIMAIYPAFYALIANDLRRVLAHSLNSQLGFMVVGIGIGTAQAMNGVIAHAFASVIYQALLFMAMGWVMISTKMIKAHQLASLERPLYLSMPWTCLFSLIGAMSLIGMPFFSGYVTKTMVVDASKNLPSLMIWGSLLFANILAIYHSAIRLHLIAFFSGGANVNAGAGAGEPVQPTPNQNHYQDAPLSMFIAMGLGALASIVIGVYPQTLYQILPFSSDYSAFHLDHFIEQMELVIFACLAYLIIKKLHLIPREKNITLLDIDWLARALPYHFRNEYQEQYLQKRQQIALFQHHLSQYFTQALRASFQMNGLIVREHSVGFMALWIAIMLAVILLLVYNL